MPIYYSGLPWDGDDLFGNGLLAILAQAGLLQEANKIRGADKVQEEAAAKRALEGNPEFQPATSELEEAVRGVRGPMADEALVMKGTPGWRANLHETPYEWARRVCGNQFQQWVSVGTELDAIGLLLKLGLALPSSAVSAAERLLRATDGTLPPPLSIQERLDALIAQSGLAEPVRGKFTAGGLRPARRLVKKKDAPARTLLARPPSGFQEKRQVLHSGMALAKSLRSSAALAEDFCEALGLAGADTCPEEPSRGGTKAAFEKVVLDAALAAGAVREFGGVAATLSPRGAAGLRAAEEAEKISAAWERERLDRSSRRANEEAIRSADAWAKLPEEEQERRKWEALRRVQVQEWERRKREAWRGVQVQGAVEGRYPKPIRLSRGGIPAASIEVDIETALDVLRTSNPDLTEIESSLRRALNTVVTLRTRILKGFGYSAPKRSAPR